MQAMRYHINVWKLCGLWDLPGNPVWYTVYSTCLYVIFYIIYPGCIAAQAAFAASFDEIIDILLILPTACAGIKGYFVLRKRRELRELFALIDRMDEAHVHGTLQRQMIGQQVDKVVPTAMGYVN